MTNELRDVIRKENAAGKFREFASGVDYLLQHVLDGSDPAISRTRARLHIAGVALKGVVSDGAAQTHMSLATVDRWVRENPWQAIGAAAALGVLISSFATGRRGRRRS